MSIASRTSPNRPAQGSSDEADARQRLLDSALDVFASKGYEGASTREICRSAGVNVAAIHYYFGDKASLYRQVFGSLEQLQRVPAELADPTAPLDRILLAVYRHLLDFASSATATQHLRALFMREQVHPTGLLSEEQMQGIQPLYEAVLRILQARVGVAADAELRLLCISLLGLAVNFALGRHTLEQVAPELVADKERTLTGLVAQGVALIKAEIVQRHGGAS